METPTDFTEGYRFHLTAEGIAPPSIKRYLEIMTLWLSWCADNAVTPLQATTKDVTRFMAHYTSKRSPSTLRSYVIGLRRLYRYFKDARMVRTNPASKTTLPKIRPPYIEPFNDHELAALLAACGDLRQRACFYLLLGGGLRIAEVGTATEPNYQAGTVRVMGKGRKVRVISPGVTAMRALKMAMAGQTTFYAPASYVNYQVKRWGKVAGLEGRVHAHRFRYTFATQFCDNGGSVEDLQTILGHAGIEMSLYYSKKGRERRALAAQLKFNPADRMVG